VVESLTIRRANPADFESLWPIFHAVVATGTTYVFSPDTPREDAFTYWFGSGVVTYVAEDGGAIVGMYRHRELGLVDAYVMYRVLDEVE